MSIHFVLASTPLGGDTFTSSPPKAGIEFVLGAAPLGGDFTELRVALGESFGVTESLPVATVWFSIRTLSSSVTISSPIVGLTTLPVLGNAIGTVSSRTSGSLDFLPAAIPTTRSTAIASVAVQPHFSSSIPRTTNPALVGNSLAMTPHLSSSVPKTANTTYGSLDGLGVSFSKTLSTSLAVIDTFPKLGTVNKASAVPVSGILTSPVLGDAIQSVSVSTRASLDALSPSVVLTQFMALAGFDTFPKVGAIPATRSNALTAISTYPRIGAIPATVNSTIADMAALDRAVGVNEIKTLAWFDTSPAVGAVGVVQSLSPASVAPQPLLSESIPASNWTSRANLRTTVKPTLALHVEVSGVLVSPTLALKVGVFGLTAPTLPLQVLVSDLSIVQASSFINSPGLWGLKVYIGGIDMTSHLTGQVGITASENSATLAEFSLLPFPGVIDVTEWVGQRVLIQYRPSGTSTWYDRFSGIVDTPTVDPFSHVTHFDCTDGMQLMFEEMPPEGVLNILGTGQWSPFLFQRTRDGWDTFHDVMSTVTGSYNLDSSGNGVFASWLSQEVPDFIFDEDVVIDQSASISLAGARDVINTVELKLDYRFTRLYEYTHTISWKFGYDNPTEYPLYFGAPALQTVVEAISGAGYAVDMVRGPLEPGTVTPSVWKPTIVQSSVPGSSAGLPMMLYDPPRFTHTYEWAVSGVSLYPIPGAGLVYNPQPQPAGTSSGVVGFASDSPRYSTVGGFSATVKRRFSAEVTESRITLLRVPASISKVGRALEKISHAIQSEYAGDRTTNLWEEQKAETVTYPVSVNGINVWGVPQTGGISEVAWLDSARLTFNRYVVDAPGPPDRTETPVAGGPVAAEYDRDKSVIDGRDRMMEAYSAAHARAVRTLMESHRHNRVTFSTEAHPLLEMYHTAKLSFGYRAGSRLKKTLAQGKVAAMRHLFDLDTGSATTEVTLALIKGFAAGAVYSSPSFDTPAVAHWDKPPPGSQPGFSYTLGVWPPDSPWDATKYNQEPVPKAFRGYNCFTGEFIIESPTPPLDSHLNNLKVMTDLVDVDLPDDLLYMEN